jgi:MOSC domain-containing protein YiiM
MRVLSVNVAVPRPNPWKRLAATGIDKQPAAGPVPVTAPGPKGNGEVGLAGDHAYDHKPGAVRTGDPIEIIHYPGHNVTVALSFRALTLEPALLSLLTDATALPQEDRDAIHRRLAGP